MNFLIRRCNICHTHIPNEYTYVTKNNPCTCHVRARERIEILLNYDTLEKKVLELEKQVVEKDRIIESLLLFPQLIPKVLSKS